jgi:SAM-dependent methyltransferase
MSHEPGGHEPGGHEPAGPEPGEERRYDPQQFWEERLRRDFTLRGVGYRNLGAPYNRSLYVQRRIVLARALRRYDILVRGADVIELGPGTGYYVELWERWGAGSVTGLDVADVVVDRLRGRFPAHRFEQADVTEPWPVEPASADLVTAFDVLFHIVDEPGFERALGQVGQALRPGGAFVVSDLFLHGPPVTAFHQVIRTLARWEEALDAAGFEILGRLPIFVAMHPPYDLPPGRRRRLAWRWWAWLEARLKADPEQGRLLGRWLGRFDRLAARLLRDGPSTELLVCRRRATAQKTDQPRARRSTTAA